MINRISVEIIQRHLPSTFAFLFSSISSLYELIGGYSHLSRKEYERKKRRLIKTNKHLWNGLGGWCCQRRKNQMMQIVSLKSDWRFRCLTCITRILIDDDSVLCNACYDCARTVFFVCVWKKTRILYNCFPFFCFIRSCYAPFFYSNTHSLFTKSDLCSFLCVENGISRDTFLFLSRYFTRHMSNIRRGYR